jgi:hypothetical protein
MILSDLASPAKASTECRADALGFTQAGNRSPLFGTMRCNRTSTSSHKFVRLGKRTSTLNDLFASIDMQSVRGDAHLDHKAGISFVGDRLTGTRSARII